MGDFFGSIAAGEIGTKRLPLVFPTPTPKNGVIFELSCSESETPFDVPAKMSTKKELDIEIERLREKYEPFFKNFAPKTDNKRKKTEIPEFQMREATSEDLSDFSRVVRGDGEWKDVKIPY